MVDEAKRHKGWMELTSAVRKMSPEARERFAELYTLGNVCSGALHEIAGRTHMCSSLSLQEEIDVMRRIAIEALGSLTDGDDFDNIDGDF